MLRNFSASVVVLLPYLALSLRSETRDIRLTLFTAKGGIRCICTSWINRYTRVFVKLLIIRFFPSFFPLFIRSSILSFHLHLSFFSSFFSSLLSISTSVIFAIITPRKIIRGNNLDARRLIYSYHHAPETWIL